jgi:hypothetical protein
MKQQTIVCDDGDDEGAVGRLQAMRTRSLKARET